MQWTLTSPAIAHIAALLTVCKWLQCERSRTRISCQKIMAAAAGAFDDCDSPVGSESRAGSRRESDAGSEVLPASILRYNVVKINRINRNSRRVFEIDTLLHSLAIVKPEYGISGHPIAVDDATNTERRVVSEMLSSPRRRSDLSLSMTLTPSSNSSLNGMKSTCRMLCRAWAVTLTDVFGQSAPVQRTRLTIATTSFFQAP